MGKPNPWVVLLSSVVIANLFVLPFVISPDHNTITGTPEENGTTDVEFTLRTVIGQEPPMAFIGVGGEIDGIINPNLTVNDGDIVRITLVNGDPVQHDLTIDAFGVKSKVIQMVDEEASVTFRATRTGIFAYYCSVPGHREAGMSGNLVSAAQGEVQSDAYKSR